MDEDGPSFESKRPSFKTQVQTISQTFTTRKGLLGDYDYAFLFRPNLPFMRKPLFKSPFFGLQDRMPVVLGLLLGLQHALAMLAGIIAPPLIFSGVGGANLTAEHQQYLVSASLIISGVLSAIQIARIKIFKTPYVPGRRRSKVMSQTHC